MKPTVQQVTKSKPRETLFARKGLDGKWRLADSNHFHIGTFETAVDCEQWCKDNDYRCIVTT